ncbi:hypothetical protein ACJX0J_023782, partial [Zea mays]
FDKHSTPPRRRVTNKEATTHQHSSQRSKSPHTQATSTTSNTQHPALQEIQKEHIVRACASVRPGWGGWLGL